MRRSLNITAFSLLETLMAVAFTSIMFVAVYNTYNMAKQAYNSGIAGQALQDGANLILARIIQGGTEPTGIYRLSEGVSYTPINSSRINFVGVDGLTRSYSTNGGAGDATQVIYSHPCGACATSSTVLGLANYVDEIIYRAPTGAIINLTFDPGTNPLYTGVSVTVYVALQQNVGGRTVSGTTSTMILLRNHI